MARWSFHLHIVYIVSFRFPVYIACDVHENTVSVFRNIPRVPPRLRCEKRRPSLSPGRASPASRSASAPLLTPLLLRQSPPYRLLPTLGFESTSRAAALNKTCLTVNVSWSPVHSRQLIDSYHVGLSTVWLPPSPNKFSNVKLLCFFLSRIPNAKSSTRNPGILAECASPFRS